MKKIVLLMGVLVMMAGIAKAQDSNVAENGPKIKFEEQIHDFGEIPNGGNTEYEYRFTNTGNEPLILTKVSPRCGCTASEWTKEPVLPGESGVVIARYKHNTKEGKFDKVIDVTSNALHTPTLQLHIKGTILPAPNETLPEKEFGVGSPINNN